MLKIHKNQQRLKILAQTQNVFHCTWNISICVSTVLQPNNCDH